jgi:hypothetical protein
MAPARDVLVACAQVAVSRGITALPADIEDETAVSMLELTAAQPASGSPGTAGGSAPTSKTRPNRPGASPCSRTR